MGKLGTDNVKHTFNSFWEISNYDRQNAYSSNIVTNSEIKLYCILNRPGHQKRRIYYTVIHKNIVHTAQCV